MSSYPGRNTHCHGHGESPRAFLRHNSAHSASTDAVHDCTLMVVMEVVVRHQDRGVLRLDHLVPCQNSFTIAELVLRAPQAALRYSLIKPWTTCLRLIWAVTSTG